MSIMILIKHSKYILRHKDRAFLKELLLHEPQNEDIFNLFKSDLIPLKNDFELGDVEEAQNIFYLQTQSFSGDTLNEKTKFVNLKVNTDQSMNILLIKFLIKNLCILYQV